MADKTITSYHRHPGYSRIIYYLSSYNGIAHCTRCRSMSLARHVEKNISLWCHVRCQLRWFYLIRVSYWYNAYWLRDPSRSDCIKQLEWYWTLSRLTNKGSSESTSNFEIFRSWPLGIIQNWFVASRFHHKRHVWQKWHKYHMLSICGVKAFRRCSACDVPR
jgi:hypothetical protein